MDLKISDKIKELMSKVNYDNRKLSSELGIKESEFRKMLEEDSVPANILFKIVKIINTSILYFYPNNKDIFSDIIEKWRYNEGNSPYTNIPLVEDIYPDNLLKTLFTSQTSVMVPFNCIKYFDSILAIRVKKLKLKDSNIERNTIAVVNFSFVSVKNSELVICYDKRNNFHIRNYYNEELFSFYPDKKPIKLKNTTIFGKIIYFQLDNLILL